MPVRLNITLKVLSNGSSNSEPFTVETGVKQGCVIAPTLFAIFITAILHHFSGEELPHGIPIMYRTDGRLFNLKRFKAKSKVLHHNYRDTVCGRYSYRRTLRRRLPGHSECFGRGVQSPRPKIKQTQVLHQSPPNQLAIQPNIKVDNTTLEYVDHFPYLSSILSSKTDIDSEVNHHLSCASGAYATLRRTIFEDRDLLAQTKLLVYRTVVLPTLLYGD